MAPSPAELVSISLYFTPTENQSYSGNFASWKGSGVNFEMLKWGGENVYKEVDTLPPAGVPGDAIFYHLAQNHIARDFQRAPAPAARTPEFAGTGPRVGWGVWLGWWGGFEGGGRGAVGQGLAHL